MGRHAAVSFISDVVSDRGHVALHLNVECLVCGEWMLCPSHGGPVLPF